MHESIPAAGQWLNRRPKHRSRGWTDEDRIQFRWAAVICLLLAIAAVMLAAWVR